MAAGTEATRRKLPIAKKTSEPEPVAWHRAPRVQHHRRMLWVTPSVEGGNTPWKTKFSAARGLFTPLGLLTAVSYFPQEWEHRIVDEDVDGAVSDEMLAWADVVCFTGMYVVAERVNTIAQRARALGKLSLAGGPAVTLGAHRFSDVDILHIGELGDATYTLIQDLDRTVERPSQQVRYVTQQALAIGEQPLPAFERIDFKNYLTCLVQYSKGCPFNCEFCDVIEIFGRVPQTKTPERFLRELELVYSLGWRGQVVCVSDNFHGNHKEARTILPQIARWQAEHDYPFRLAAAATIDVAEHPDLVEKYAKAGFFMLGIGIESAEFETLVHMQKKQNTRRPLTDSIDIIHGHGVEVAAGFILGFDTDHPGSGQAIIDVVENGHLPITSIGRLVALDGTQLYRRMEREGRLLPSYPYMTYKPGTELVGRMFDQVAQRIYDPGSIFERWSYHVEHVKPNSPPEVRMTGQRFVRTLRRELTRRLKLTNEIGQDSQGRPFKYRPGISKLGMAARLVARGFWELGLRSEQRAAYWRFLARCLRARDLVSAMAAPAMVIINPSAQRRTESSLPMAMPPTQDAPAPAAVDAHTGAA